MHKGELYDALSLAPWPNKKPCIAKTESCLHSTFTQGLPTLRAERLLNSGMMHRVLCVAVWLGVVVVCHGQALPDCPPVDHRDANATLFANPSNCSTFFICRQGTPLLFECPANLHFNDRLKVCDHQLDADCVEQQPPVPTPEVTKVTVTKVQKEVVVVKPAPEVVPVAEGPVDPLSKPVVSEEPVDPVVALV